MALYAARQPILDRNKKLVAYELLFRENLDNVFPDINDDEATSKIVEGTQFNLGLEAFTQDKLAFINFTQDTLLQGYPMLLPKDKVVIEILETVRPGKKLLEVCKQLKQKGYLIALDDYEHQAVWKHFYPITDIIKIDYQLTPLTEIKQVIKAIRPHPQIKLLAEKVETYQQFEQASELGFEYFQGYFFSRPEVLKSVTLEPGQLSLARLMAEMTHNNLDVDKVAKVFEQDVTLAFKLLRYAQSPLFKRHKAIESIKQAIVALGQDELRRFVSVLFTARFAQDKPSELTSMSLTRAKLCENLAAKCFSPKDTPIAFLVGMLSLLDALLDTKLDELIEKLPVSDSIKNALISQQGPFAKLLECCHFIEQADWQSLTQISAELKLDLAQIEDCYKEAIFWSSVHMSTG